MNLSNIAYRLNTERDLEPIVSLLKKADLPVADITRSKIDFIVALDNNALAGVIGLEHYGTNGLLRSMAIDAVYRNNGIGAELLQRLLSYAKQLGINDLHLLTTTAEKYFASKGFVTSTRSYAPDVIQNTEEFSSICPSSSAYMILKDLNNSMPFHADR